MAEEIGKPKQITNNNNVINVRLGGMTKSDVEKFAKEVYGFKNTSVFMRHVLDFIVENKPTLGKAFAPESAST